MLQTSTIHVKLKIENQKSSIIKISKAFKKIRVFNVLLYPVYILCVL